jgi:hypothetical protein
MWCTIQGIFMLCVVSVVIAVVIGADVGTHDIPLVKVKVVLWRSFFDKG